jgi:hypothetical protein
MPDRRAAFLQVSKTVSRDHGKLLLIPGQRNLIELDLLVERVAVEKT